MRICRELIDAEDAENKQQKEQQGQTAADAVVKMTAEKKKMHTYVCANDYHSWKCHQWRSSF